MIEWSVTSFFLLLSPSGKLMLHHKMTLYLREEIRKSLRNKLGCYYGMTSDILFDREHNTNIRICRISTLFSHLSISAVSVGLARQSSCILSIMRQINISSNGIKIKVANDPRWEIRSGKTKSLYMLSTIRINHTEMTRRYKTRLSLAKLMMVWLLSIKQSGIGCAWNWHVGRHTFLLGIWSASWCKLSK